MASPIQTQTGGHLDLDSTQLYAACGSADSHVQAEAYEALWHYLYRTALQVVRDQADAEAAAQDCAQAALIRVHERLPECREPAAFSVWARRIASRIAIDHLRRAQRVVPLSEDEPDSPSARLEPVLGAEASAFETVQDRELRRLLAGAPISARSLRVVVGRYLDGTHDLRLAEAESRSSGQPVLSSHVQVTRAKDLAKLRNYAPLRAFLNIGD